MGVTIHYKGQLKTPDFIPELVSELEDICNTNGWKSHIINETLDLSNPKRKKSVLADEVTDAKSVHVQGIHFKPHEESESVSMIFDEEGNLVNLLSLMMGIGVKSRYHSQFTKTQFAGPDVHIQLIHFFVYLKKKYFKKLTINDEGGYYPKNDRETLVNRMGFISNAINTVSDIFENSEFKGKTPDEMMGQIEEALNRSFKDIKVQIIKLDGNEIPDELKKRLDDDLLNGLDDMDHLEF